MYELKNERERAILVGVTTGAGRWETEDHLDELALLTDTAGALVLEKIIQKKRKIDPTYFIGRGKAEDLSMLINQTKADMLIFDDDLSPAQVRNLEQLTKKKILDRTGIILDIFARRAKSKEARTQVELAQLEYLLPRLTRQWSHLSRQVGGIGTRGPGETQLEVDRRMIRKRISKLSDELLKIKKQRQVRRRCRKRNFKVALVGYTNAGKSTLMNTLTKSDVFVENRLFSTLDPMIRRMKISEQLHVLLIDTVGFIRKLPHHLVVSFMSTLEEAVVADLLLHVVDISHPLIFDQIAVAKDVLSQLGISEKPTIYVFNKVDNLDKKGLISRLKNDYQPSVFVSAEKGLFLEDLKNEITRIAQESTLTLKLQVDIGDSDIISKVYDLSEVLDVKYNEKNVQMRVKLSRENSDLLNRLLSKDGKDVNCLSRVESNGI